MRIWTRLCLLVVLSIGPLASICLAEYTEIITPQSVHPSRGCYYGVDGICVPKRASYGFYAARWRPWPAGATAEAAESRTPLGVPSLPAGEVPNESEEGDISTSVPGKQWPLLQRLDQGNTEKAKPNDFDQDLQKDPFQDDPLFEELSEPQAWLNLEESDSEPMPSSLPGRHETMRGPRLSKPKLIGREPAAPLPYRTQVRRANAIEPVLEPVPTSGWSSSNPLRPGESVPEAGPPVVDRPAIAIIHDVAPERHNRSRNVNPLR